MIDGVRTDLSNSDEHFFTLRRSYNLLSDQSYFMTCVPLTSVTSRVSVKRNVSVDVKRNVSVDVKSCCSSEGFLE